MANFPTALITVRSSSKRLPGKCFLPLGGLSILQHVIQRAQYGGFEPIVCTSSQDADSEIVDIARLAGVRFFQGSLENKIMRWKDCMEEFELARVHLIDADDPYFDFDEMHESYQLLDTPYDLVLTSKKSDAGYASVGTSITYGYVAILNERATTLKSQNFDVIPWDLLIRDNDSVYQLPNKDYSVSLETDLRLTLDYPEDYELLKIIAQKFTFAEKRLEIEKFLIENLTFRQINLFRNKDFLQNKEDTKIVEFG